MQTAATLGIAPSPGCGRTALEHIAATFPGVSAPSSVVRSMQRMARSSAHSFDVFLIDRFARAAARSSTPTWSTLRTPRITEPRWVSSTAVVTPTDYAPGSGRRLLSGAHRLVAVLAVDRPRAGGPEGHLGGLPAAAAGHVEHLAHRSLTAFRLSPLVAAVGTSPRLVHQSPRLIELLLADREDELSPALSTGQHLVRKGHRRLSSFGRRGARRKPGTTPCVPNSTMEFGRNFISDWAKLPRGVSPGAVWPAGRATAVAPGAPRATLWTACVPNTNLEQETPSEPASVSTPVTASRSSRTATTRRSPRPSKRRSSGPGQTSSHG